LSAHGQALAVTKSPVTADVLQVLDIHRDITPKVALNRKGLVNILSQLTNVGFGQVLDSYVGAYPGSLQNLVRSRAAYTENIGKTDFYPLFSRQINAGNTCHFYESPFFFLDARLRLFRLLAWNF
jgi:hypothetical protein